MLSTEFRSVNNLCAYSLFTSANWTVSEVQTSVLGKCKAEWQDCACTTNTCDEWERGGKKIYLKTKPC